MAIRRVHPHDRLYLGFTTLCISRRDASRSASDRDKPQLGCLEAQAVRPHSCSSSTLCNPITLSLPLLSVDMLKRQRPSSPLPMVAEAPLAAEPSVDIEMLERVAKRTRHCAPLRRSYVEKNSVIRNYDTDGEEDQEDEGRSEYTRGQAKWQEQAGLYKTANTLLHDLHAEQRHRQLFSAKPSASIHHQQDTCCPSSHSLDSFAHSPLCVASKPHEETPLGTMSPHISSVHHGGLEHTEAQTVSSQYEDTNRFAIAPNSCLTLLSALFFVGS